MLETRDKAISEITRYYEANGSSSAPEVKPFMCQFLESRGINGERGLDIGCGEGHLLRMLVEHNIIREGAGVDISRPALERAAIQNGMSGRIRFEYSEANHLPFEDAHFDLITCTEVMQNLPDWKDAIREWARVLRPGGHLAFSCPYYFNLLLPNKYFGDLLLALRQHGNSVPYRWSLFGPSPFEHKFRVGRLTTAAETCGLSRVYWCTTMLHVAVHRSCFRLPLHILLGKRFWDGDFYTRAMNQLSRWPGVRAAGSKLYMVFAKPVTSGVAN